MTNKKYKLFFLKVEKNFVIQPEYPGKYKSPDQEELIKKLIQKEDFLALLSEIVMN